MHRPMALRRAGILSARISADRQQGKRAARSRSKFSLSAFFGDLLIGLGFVKPTLSLDELDPVLADLRRQEAVARSRHSNVRCIQQERTKRVHKLLAGDAA